MPRDTGTEYPLGADKTEYEEVGWTKAEYDQRPELVDRLHRRILDLRDEVDEVCDERDSLLSLVQRLLEKAPSDENWSYDGQMALYATRVKVAELTKREEES